MVLPFCMAKSGGKMIQLALTKYWFIYVIVCIPEIHGGGRERGRWPTTPPITPADPEVLFLNIEIETTPQKKYI